MEAELVNQSDPPMFVDDAERGWEVREIRDPVLSAKCNGFVRPEYANGWLLFTSGEERRRLAPLPPGWRFATQEQLRVWCREATPARPC